MDEILVYGARQFGAIQALDYQAGLEARFAEIAVRPLSFPACPELAPDLRRGVFAAHAIYFRAIDPVLIVRILGKQDPVGAFE